MRVVLPALAVLASSLCAACGGGGGDDGVDPNDPLPPPDPREGFQIAMETTVPAGTEIWECKVTELPTDEFTPVNFVESVQSAGVHHMDVTALAFAGVDLEVGTYDCNELYRDFPELMEDGLIIYAAQQADQHIQLPEGTIANLPGGLKVMQELHYVNATSSDVQAFSKINVYRYDGDIQQEIWGGAVRDTEMDIPPGDSVEWTRCVMTDDVDVLFLSSHTHQLGRKFEVRLFDGEAVGELIYENTDWHTPQLLAFGDQPLHVAAGTGFEFQCHYTNDTADTVHWGFGAEDEMCQIAYVFTPGEANRKCEVVASSTTPTAAR